MRRAILVAAVIVSVALLVPTGAPARLLPPGVEPMQLSYRLWSVQWTKMALERDPRSPTSLFAVRGGQCGLAFGKAWLLPVSLGGMISTRCRIPAGKLLIVPVAGTGSVGGPQGPNREEDLRRRARRSLRDLGDVRLTVDGRSMRPGYVAWTPLFIVDLPPHNLFGPPSAANPPGLANVVAVNYLAILSPLPRGRHVVTTSGTFRTPDGPRTDAMTFQLRVG